MARRAGRSPTRAGPDSDEPGECFGKTRAFAASVAADVAGRLHCDQLLGLHAAPPLRRRLYAASATWRRLYQRRRLYSKQWFRPAAGVFAVGAPRL